MLAVALRISNRRVAVLFSFLVLSGIATYIGLRPGIVQAYPTSFFASTQAYAAPSVSRGAPLYEQNCIACHGVSGRGDGPAARSLPVRPADLTEEHLFAHKVGEMYWWIGNGKGGVMPGFADKLTEQQRWDLINFILARAAGDLTRTTGTQLSTAASAPIPDFAFEQNGAQNTLSQTLKAGPVLLVIYSGQAPRARLEQLAKAKVQVVAIGPGASKDVREMLALFVTPKDGSETELMLDRGGNVRARWTAATGLASVATLIADATRVAAIPVAAANHAGHGQ
jgi:mono/diheme cytochrome c family protein